MQPSNGSFDLSKLVQGQQGQQQTQGFGGLSGIASMNSMFGGQSDNLFPIDSYASEINQHEHIKKLKDKFADLKEEINLMGKDPEVFRSHQLPLARVKKIMKSDEDVRMISAEAPVLFAKACEIFIIELTHRAWLFTEEGKRRTLQKNDIASCIYNTEIFDFLIDILPKEDQKAAQQQVGKKPTQEAFQSLNPLLSGGFMKEHGLLGNMGMNQQQQQQQQHQLISDNYNNQQQNLYGQNQMLQQQQQSQQNNQSYGQNQQQYFRQQQSQSNFQNQVMQGMNTMDNIYSSGLVKEEQKKYYDQ